jgi:hypothetical protein
LVGKPEGKRPLGRPTRKWEHNTRIGIKEIERETRDWIHLAMDRDQWLDFCENGNEPSDSIKCGEFLDWLKSSRQMIQTALL